MKNIDLGPHNRADQWAEDTGLRIAKWLVYTAAASLCILALAGALWVLAAVVRGLA